MKGGVEALSLRHAMALCFPPLPQRPDIAPVAGHAAAAMRETIAAGLHAALDDEWWLFRDRTVGGASVPFVLLHRLHGIAVVPSETAPDGIVAGLRRLLDEAGFSGTFRGTLPIVSIGIADLADGSPGDTIPAAFGPAPALSVDDPDWVEWVADQLTVETDLVSTATAPPPAADASGGLLVLLPPDDETAFARPDEPAAAPSHIPPGFSPAREGASAALPPDALSRMPPSPTMSTRGKTDGGRRQSAAALAGIVGLGSVALASVVLALSTIPSATPGRPPNADWGTAGSSMAADDLRRLSVPTPNVVPQAHAEAVAIRPPAPAAPAPASPEGEASGSRPRDGGDVAAPAPPEAALPAEDDRPAALAERYREPSRRRAQALRSSRAVAAEAPPRFRPWWERLKARPVPEQPYINRNQP
jgi:hypothetical protein